MEPIAALGLAERFQRLVWRVHFRIPPSVYTSFVIVAALAMLVGRANGWLLLGALAVFIVSLIGRVRWWRESHPPADIVVPRFSAPRAQQGTAREVQDDVVTTVRDMLGDDSGRRVRSIDATIGRESPAIARSVMARLRCRFLLYGSIRPTQTSHSVFARLIFYRQAGPTAHIDPHTREQLFIRRRAPRTVFYTLTPAIDVSALQEYSYDFARDEIPALLKSVEGDIANDLERFGQAERRYRDALSLANEGESETVDHVRDGLARSIANQGRGQEAIDLLRKRAKSATASPDLLLTLVTMLNLSTHKRFRRDGMPDDIAQEAIKYCRQALERGGGHSRDQIRYHLAQFLWLDPEGEDILYDLLTERGPKGSKSYYARAWYVKMQYGARRFFRAQELLNNGQTEAAQAEARQAATWYSSALWARRWQVGVAQPILHANAVDAYRLAGNHQRARYHRLRRAWLTYRLHRHGRKALESQDWVSAYEFFEWGLVGAKDWLEVKNLVLTAIALRQWINDQEARNYSDELWQRALSLEPFVARSVRDGVGERMAQLPGGLPE